MFKVGDRIKDTTTDKGTYKVTDVQDKWYLLSRGTWDWRCSKKYVEEHFKLVKEDKMETIKIKDWGEIKENKEYAINYFGNDDEIILYAKKDGNTRRAIRILCGVLSDEKILEILTIFGFNVEFVEPIKLTEQEYHFVRAFKEGWLVGDDTGMVGFYEEKPEKRKNYWNGWKKAILPKDMFKFITWDSEPWSIEELQKLEMEV